MKFFSNASSEKNNQKGQTLVIVIIMMVLALSVGITISSRFTKTLRDITEYDNSSRALAAAEAAIERMLIVPNETLEEYINFGSCGSDCVLEISGVFGYKSRADVVLSFAGSSNDPYELKGSDGEVSQVSLDGYGSGSTLNVCWNDGASVYASYIYDQSGVIKSDIYAFNPVSYAGYENGFSEASPLYGYQNCFTVNTIGTPKVLRIKPYNFDSFIYVIPASSQSIPSQGVLITSTGRSGNAVRTVKVLKSSASAPEFFDYAIYQKSTEDPLSNRSN